MIAAVSSTRRWDRGSNVRKSGNEDETFILPCPITLMVQAVMWVDAARNIDIDAVLDFAQ